MRCGPGFGGAVLRERLAGPFGLNAAKSVRGVERMRECWAEVEGGEVDRKVRDFFLGQRRKKLRRGGGAWPVSFRLGKSRMSMTVFFKFAARDLWACFVALIDCDY